MGVEVWIDLKGLAWSKDTPERVGVGVRIDLKSVEVGVEIDLKWLELE